MVFFFLKLTRDFVKLNPLQIEGDYPPPSHTLTFYYFVLKTKPLFLWQI